MSSLVYVKRLRHHRWTVLCIAAGVWFNSWPLSGLCSLAVSHHLLSSCCQTMSYSLLLSVTFYYCMFHPDVLQPPGAVGPWYARFAFLQVQRNLWSKDGGIFMKIEETVSFQSFHLFGGEEGEARYWWGISCNYSACMFFFVSFLHKIRSLPKKNTELLWGLLQGIQAPAALLGQQEVKAQRYFFAQLLQCGAASGISTLVTHSHPSQIINNN